MVLDARVPTLAEYIQSQSASHLNGPDGTPLYAHPVDEWILRSLNSAPVRHMLDKAIDTIISIEFGQYLANGIFIDQKTFPELYELLNECAQTLGIPLPHTLAHDSFVLFQAFTAGTDEYSFISISAGLTKFFSPQEAKFVIGHECGHIAAKHLVYHTLVWVLANTTSRYLGPLGRLISSTAGFPLRAWARRSEITCDRAGHLCCGDLKTSERALLRLVAGFADVDQIDVDDYLEKYREMQEYHSVSSWQQAFFTHPAIPKRIEALRLFDRSELYYDLTGKPRPEGETLLPQQELNRLVEQMVKP
jgi:Zn-dependent protease with chaperone function